MLVRSVGYASSINTGQAYLFRTFEEASYFIEKSGSRLKRRCRGVLRDQCEYESELGKGGGR